MSCTERGCRWGCCCLYFASLEQNTDCCGVTVDDTGLPHTRVEYNVVINEPDGSYTSACGGCCGNRAEVRAGVPSGSTGGEGDIDDGDGDGDGRSWEREGMGCVARCVRKSCIVLLSS